MSGSKDQSQSKVKDEDMKGESASPTSTTGAKRSVTWSPEVRMTAHPAGGHHYGPSSFRKSRTLPHSSTSSSKQRTSRELSENEFKENQEKKKRASDRKKKEEIIKMLKSGNIDVYKELLLQEVEGGKKGISKSTYRFKRCVFDPNCKSLSTTDIIEKAELDRILRKSDGKGKVQFFFDVLNAMKNHYDVAHTETDSDKILITFLLRFLPFIEKELEELTSASQRE